MVCSDLGRARETAELLGLRPARFDPRWREIDVGAWGGRRGRGDRRPGRRADELARRAAAGAATASRGTPSHARVAGAIDELVAAGGPWLVVCHGGCIRAAVAHVTGADALALGSPPNASATVFELGARPRLLVYGSLPDGGLPTGCTEARGTRPDRACGARAAEAGAAHGWGGGGLRSIRAMASGLAHPQWNSADVTAPDADLDAALTEFAARVYTRLGFVDAGALDVYGDL